MLFFISIPTAAHMIFTQDIKYFEILRGPPLDSERVSVCNITETILYGKNY